MYMKMLRTFYRTFVSVAFEYFEYLIFSCDIFYYHII